MWEIYLINLKYWKSIDLKERERKKKEKKIRTVVWLAREEGRETNWQRTVLSYVVELTCLVLFFPPFPLPPLLINKQTAKLHCPMHSMILIQRFLLQFQTHLRAIIHTYTYIYIHARTHAYDMIRTYLYICMCACDARRSTLVSLTPCMRFSAYVMFSSASRSPDFAVPRVALFQYCKLRAPSTWQWKRQLCASVFWNRRLGF